MKNEIDTVDLSQLSKNTQDITVLYVEDEKNVREQTLRMLGILFQNIETANDGLEAWEKYQEGRYDIVFTDISMPRMDGLTLIQKIKEQESSQKIVIFSAYNTAEYLLEAIELGVDGFIMKPIEMDKMILTIKKVTDSIFAQKLLQNYHEELRAEVEAKTKTIQQQIVTDKLTGLPNRFALNLVLDELKEERAFILVNIDNFDSINTIYGYDNGNKIIRAIAQLLQEHLLEGCELYYLGSDEFGLLCEETDKNKITAYAEKLQRCILNFPLSLENNRVKLTATIAITIGNKELLKRAHIALKEAKNNGKNRIKFYTEALAIERLQHQIQRYSPIIREALENDKIVPFFQPIIDNYTHKVAKYECLARIIDGDQIYSPFYFIDVAQMIGAVQEITKVMIDKSFAAFADNDYEFSINITENDLHDEYLVEYFRQKLKEYGMSPSRVVLEVLEGVSATGVSNSIHQLVKLKECGFKIAIDDFGTQNSNFERVNSMNVDFIKIDGSFVKKIATDEKSYSIVKTISNFAKSIGAQTVAEYVDNEEVQKRVEELGIEFSQGYYFAPPSRELVAV